MTDRHLRSPDRPTTRTKIVDLLSTDEWVSHRDLARHIGHAVLNGSERRALHELLETGVIEEFSLPLSGRRKARWYRRRDDRRPNMAKFVSDDNIKRLEAEIDRWEARVDALTDKLYTCSFDETREVRTQRESVMGHLNGLRQAQKILLSELEEDK